MHTTEVMTSTQPNSYQEQWQEYRRLRSVFFLVWALYLPVVATCTVIWGARFGESTPGFVISAIAWMALVLFASDRVSNWRCPRCGESFVGEWGNRVFSVKECVHCGLPKFAADENGGQKS